jgi:malonyl CoA-acyl carrier protein transacylase
LFEQFPRQVEQANAILGYDLPALCQHSGPKLNDTAFTQPALFTVNALAEMSVRRTGVEPDFAIGHSLGEYNALLSVGVIDFETGLQLVRFMADAAAEFRQFCACFSFKPDRLPVVSNLSARPHDGRDWPERLSDHLTRPVQWRQTLAYLRQQGPMLFQEIGPGTVLTTLAKANLTLH